MKAFKTALIILAATLTLAFGGGASANSNGGGNSAYAPGQAYAHDTCDAVKDRQVATGVSAGGGPKSVEYEAPTNCDHYYNW